MSISLIIGKYFALLCLFVDVLFNIFKIPSIIAIEPAYICICVYTEYRMKLSPGLVEFNISFNCCVDRLTKVVSNSKVGYHTLVASYTMYSWLTLVIFKCVLHTLNHFRTLLQPT